MESKAFLAASNSKHVQNYFEAVGHFNKREWPETLAAAKVVLADKTLPRALQIKSHILIFVATSDWKEANEARQAAEKIWEDENDRIEVERRALGRLREALDELDKDDSEEEESDMEEEDVEMEEDELEDEEEDAEGVEEGVKLELDAPVEESTKSSIESNSEAADQESVPIKLESNIDTKHEADVKRESEHEAGGPGDD